jgi:hypothetical protein
MLRKAPSLPWLLPLALLASGCAEDELERRATRAADAVQLAHREPGAGCRFIDTLEVTSRPLDPPSRPALVAYAVARSANYITVDTFSVYADQNEDLVLTRARLFACPERQYAAQ